MNTTSAKLIDDADIILLHLMHFRGGVVGSMPAGPLGAGGLVGLALPLFSARGRGHFSPDVEHSTYYSYPIKGPKS